MGLLHDDAPAPPLRTRFAAPGYSASVHRTEPFRFCDTCQLNQHKLTASLAQLDAADEDEDGARRRRRRRNIQEERARLEQLYPQVCEDCEQGAAAQIVASQKLARQDYLRRKIADPRSTSHTGATDFSILGTVLLLTRMLWLGGLFGQMAWNVANILVISPVYASFLQAGWILETYVAQTAQLVTSQRWATWSLLMSLASCWYSPYFKHAHRGFWTVVEGFRQYYAGTVGLLALRVVAYFVLTAPTFSQTLPEIVQLAHGLEAVVVIVLVTRNHGAIKLDNSKLFDTSPQQFAHVGPAKITAASAPSTMSKTQLNAKNMHRVDSSKDVTGSSRSWTANLKLPLQQQDPARVSNRGSHQQSQTKLQSDLQGAGASASFPHRASTANPSYLSASLFEQRAPTGLSQSLMVRGSSYRQRSPADSSTMQSSVPDAGPWSTLHEDDLLNASDSMEGDTDMEMDWEPVNNAALEFRPHVSVSQQGAEHAATQTADDESSYNPFRTRVPSPVITPAQRARNPPRRPAITAPSEAAKENFFQTMLESGKTGSWGKGTTKQEIRLAPPKFFYREPGTDLGDELADSFTSTAFFTGVKDEPGQRAEQPQHSNGRPSSRRHLLAAMAYLGAILFCQRIHSDRLEVWLALVVIDVLCLAHGLTHVHATGDAEIPYRDQRLLLGGGQSIAAAYMIYRAVAVDRWRVSTTALRVGMLGIMLAFEGWLDLTRA